MNDVTTYQMKLQPSPLEKIKRGTKVIEIRLNDEKRRLVKVGDRIEFSLVTDSGNKVEVEVIGLETFSTFKELFSSYPPEQYGGTSADEYGSMYQYYTSEDEIRYGVLAIKFRLLA